MTGSHPRGNVDTVKIVGNELKKARRFALVSGEELAGHLGVDKKTIFQWEGGHNAITLARFIEFCQALDLDPRQILGRIMTRDAELKQAPK